MITNAANTLYTASIQYVSLDKHSVDHACEEFINLRNAGIIMSNCEFEDTVWHTTDEYSNVGIYFTFNEVAYAANYADIFGIPLSEFCQYVKAHVVSMFGRYALNSIRSFVLDVRHIITCPVSDLYAVTDDLSLYVPMVCTEFLSSLPTFASPEIEQMIVSLDAYSENAIADGKQRSLASFETYMVFGELMERFWSELLSQAERLFYFPLYFWWRFTSVIPLRPREFLLLARDCIKMKADGNYTITVRRNKIKGSQKVKSYKISEDYIEQELDLPSELGNMLQEYIDATSQYANTELNTLFVADPHYHKWGRKKLSKSRYLTYTNIVTILRYFYADVVCNRYGYRIVDDSVNRHLDDKEIGIIHLGDTRHIAMINLMQSGATPVMAMLLAGHDNIITGAHYYTNLTRMIECRTYRQYMRYLNGDTACSIIPSMTAPPTIAESSPLRDGGYCYSAEFQNGSICDCIEVIGPNGEIGYCPKCSYYRRNNSSFWDADDIYIRDIKSDLDALKRAVQIVRDGKGFTEDIYETLLKLRASSLSYEMYLTEKLKHESTRR